MTETPYSPPPAPGGTGYPGAPYPVPVMRPPLRRSREDRVVAGVCGGVGRTLGIDPLLFRVLVVAFTVVGGAGLVAYLVGWLAIPEDGAPTSEGQRLYDEVRSEPSTARSVLLVVGAVVVALISLPLLGALFFGAGDGGAFFGTLVLAAAAIVGIAVWTSRRPAAPVAPTPAPAQPMASAEPGAGGTETLVLPTGYDPAAAPAGYAYGGTGGYGPYGGAPTGFVPPAAAPVVKRERSALGAITVSLAVLSVGVLATVALLGGSVPVVAYLAVPLTVLGLGILVGTVVGRARWLLVLAIPLALMTALVGAVPTTVRDTAGAGVGDRVWAPTSVVAASSEYRLAAGDARLDLTDVPLTTAEGAAVPVRARLGVGQLIVLVPATATVRIDATVGVGELRVPGEPRRSGTSMSEITVLTPVGTSTGSLDLTLEVGIGNLEVRRATS